MKKILSVLLLIARSHKQNLKEKHMEFVRRMV